jgi:hypothetical protein
MDVHSPKPNPPYLAVETNAPRFAGGWWLVVGGNHTHPETPEIGFPSRLVVPMTSDHAKQRLGGSAQRLGDSTPATSHDQRTPGPA